MKENLFLNFLIFILLEKQGEQRKKSKRSSIHPLTHLPQLGQSPKLYRLAMMAQHHQLPPGSALAESRSWEQGQDLTPGTLLWNAGVPEGISSTLSEVHPHVHALGNPS